MHNDWNDELDILSAENVQFTVEAAGLGSRLGAVTIDLTLQGLVIAGLAWAALAISSYVFPYLAGGKQWAESLITPLYYLVPFAITLGYGFFFEWLWDGQTPGKRWLGLRVMQTSGMPITVWEAMVRNVLRLVDFLPLFYGLGAFVAIINGQNRRVGDLVAGTIVARERHDATKSKILDIDAAADAFLAATMPGALAMPIAAPAPQPQRAFRLPFQKPPDTATPTSSKPDSSTPNAPVSAARSAGMQSEAMQATAMQNGAPSQSYSQNNPPPNAARTTTQAAPGDAPLLDPQTQALLDNIPRLREADIELLHEFMARRARLKGPSRVRLAQGLAARLSAQMGHTPPLPVHVEPWLEMLARALHHARNSAP